MCLDQLQNKATYRASCTCKPMKPTSTVALSFQKDAVDAAAKPDGGTSGVLRSCRICYVAILSTTFWAVASVLSKPSAFSLPLLSRVTIARLPTLEQPQPVITGQSAFPSPSAAAARENSSGTVPADRCAGRYIYMYDLPPRFNDDIVRGCRTLRPWMDVCPYVANCGMGQALDDKGDGVFPGRGWYATDQFMLDVIFHYRMKRYECLTGDPALAAAVFVPFYASLDGGRHLWNSTSTRDALALDLVAWLARRPEWRAMGGRDHFLVAGRTAWDFLRKTDADEEWGTKLLNLPAVRNMTALVLETSPWNGTNLAVPYPTYFHPDTAADVRAWQEKARRAERRWLFSFAGAPRPGSKKTVRAEIIRQCGVSSRCRLFHCTKSSDCESSPGRVMRVFESSSFCLQPRGDTATRRSTFDAVLDGCIPVFFHPDSAYTQYALHLPMDHPERWSVLIMHTDMTGPRNVSIEETLSKIPPEAVMAMREEVIGLIPRVVYADPRSRRVDFRDAFDVAVEAVVERVAKRRRHDDEER
ncbi:xyloglucan galactosyltransferase KATAMARI1 homolog [Phragmites australis]|uniref:xyloglucan galactosyltransferase KATAMARI1 homolog n=1 Tax=Phragmites australis TaxID=29695 RepID=UPI002D76B5F5|nr:xyloglucan galactosyltransferase KATAMARI1 homolog [Phragmites australis]